MPSNAMVSRWLAMVALVSSLSGCMVIVNYTGDAAADLALIFDLGVDMKILDEEEVSR